MNVTIEISNQIYNEARHRANDAGVSLSGWIEGLIQKELSRSKVRRQGTLLELLGNEKLAEYELEFPRDKS